MDNWQDYIAPPGPHDWDFAPQELIDMLSARATADPAMLDMLQWDATMDAAMSPDAHESEYGYPACAPVICDRP